MHSLKDWLFFLADMSYYFNAVAFVAVLLLTASSLIPSLKINFRSRDGLLFLFYVAAIDLVGLYLLQNTVELAPYAEIVNVVTAAAIMYLSPKLHFSPTKEVERLIKLSAKGTMEKIKPTEPSPPTEPAKTTEPSPPTEPAKTTEPDPPAPEVVTPNLVVDPSRPKIAAPSLTAGFFAQAAMINVNGTVNKDLSERIWKECQLAAKSSDILIKINCEGGDVGFAQEIYTALRLLVTDPSKDVRVLVAGKCYSAAITILLAVPVEKRYGSRQSRYMIHSGQVSRFGIELKRSELDDAARSELEWYNANFTVNVVAASTRISKPSLEELLETDHLHYLDPDEALEMNLIGSMIE